MGFIIIKIKKFTDNDYFQRTKTKLSVASSLAL